MRRRRRGEGRRGSRVRVEEQVATIGRQAERSSTLGGRRSGEQVLIRWFWPIGLLVFMTSSSRPCIHTAIHCTTTIFCPSDSSISTSLCIPLLIKAFLLNECNSSLPSALRQQPDAFDNELREIS